MEQDPPREVRHWSAPRQKLRLPGALRCRAHHGAVELSRAAVPDAARRGYLRGQLRRRQALGLRAREQPRHLKSFIESAFPTGFVTAVEGGRDANKALLDEPFDYIFFTGSVAVGKTVMEAAAKRLTPVTLELGGKSPIIVDETANLPLAARRLSAGAQRRSDLRRTGLSDD